MMDKNILDMEDDASIEGYDLSMKNLSTDALSILNSTFLNDLNSTINDEVDINIKTRLKFILLYDLKEIYSSLCLFKSDDIIMKFKNLGFTDQELVWLFQYNELVEILNNIESNEAVESVNKVEILKIIRYYTNIKIWLVLIEKFKIIDLKSKIPVNINRLKSVLSNYTQKINYRTKQNKEFEVTQFDALWQQLDEEEQLHKKEGITKEKLFLNLLSKSDQVLIPIYNDFIEFKELDNNGKKISVNNCYQIAYPLFQYLMPDKSNWYQNEKAFIESDDKSGYTFDMLMAKRMQRFLVKDKSQVNKEAP